VDDHRSASRRRLNRRLRYADEARMKFKCAHCGKAADKPTGHVQRARAQELRLFCDRRCSGLGRRKGKTKAELIAEKKAYDAEYRAKNRAMLKAKKHEYFQRTYDPEKAAEYRKGRMPLHVEYCRQPEYKKWKREYDRRLRAKEYGPFAEVYILSLDLNREIKGRKTNEQIKYENGCTNKSQRREREAGQAPSRNRHSTANR
jgi:hypothetical protein